MATKIKPFNLDTTVDTHVKGLIDSAYINARASNFDSSSAIGLIDSDYISLRQDAADSASINTIITTTTITGKIAADLRTNPKNLSRSHTIDSNSNGLLVGPFNVDSGVTITVNGTLMVV
mgnify:CR=1 FL=1|tara:strand:+ start:1791 stop:2150 length:360 start_codon:yes stop_codon:yes gene_type:complete